MLEAGANDLTTSKKAVNQNGLYFLIYESPLMRMIASVFDFLDVAVYCSRKRKNTCDQYSKLFHKPAGGQRSQDISEIDK